MPKPTFKEVGSINPTLCPLCQKANLCGQTIQPDKPCWCMEESIPKALIEKAGNGKQCICQKCAATFKAGL